ncbi:hypothetical protein [Bacillus anthracis]|uniref:Uncharacterized protein n=1 Tax=Bacillus anthracis TaxID=1392 RepID=Q6EZM1_BACAN|nr:hypothetical protein [Bacillus anthracis]AAM26105.1 conserved hypothetical protein [Bacillus anthracis str. A2012]AAT28901.2 hypothetical protein GBAA_pXO1_0158.2 [Bacillus anthracis str. 'Ames Ancestor']ACP17842.1 hypothetical protein BAMEG_A0155 [Bacillus anthracis str. CDC 684]AFH87016.1 Hypothetical Protein H9401_5631 [Bacillus anthracis str. H9401]AHK41773.1 hypothetical protein BAPAT_pXO10155 [Bacillus anthracis str. SVA11]
MEEISKKGMIPLQNNTLDLNVSINISTNGKSKVTPIKNVEAQG